VTGWPWPLDGVQAWFEGLYNWVSESVYIAGNWLWQQLSPIFGPLATWVQDRINEFWAALESFARDPVGFLAGVISAIGASVQLFVEDPTGAITTFFGSLWGNISTALSGLTSAALSLLQQAGEWISSGLSWLANTLFGWVTGALRWATDTFKWMQTVVTDSASWVSDQVRTLFDGAAASISEVINSIFGPIGESLSRFVTMLQSITAADFLPDLFLAFQAATNTVGRAFQGLFTASSPLTPIEAYERATSFIPQATAAFMAQADINIIAETLSAGQVDISLETLMRSPALTSAISTVNAIYAVGVETSLLIPLRQYYLGAFTPMLPPIPDATRMYWRGILEIDQLREIAEYSGYRPLYQRGYLELAKNVPGPGDLITFVVREVISPSDFNIHMSKQGFGAEWASAYWQAHWVLPAFDRLVDAFHRGLLSEAEFNKFIVWHDYSPEPRPGIGKSDLDILRGLLKMPIPRVDLRRGWELGAIPDDELVKRFEWLGYEDDAPLMARIAKMEALEAERNRLIDNVKRDYAGGYISEVDLRARLGELGVPSYVAEYHASDALEDRERKHKADLTDLYVDTFVKDYPGWSEDALRTALAEVIVESEVIDLLVAKAIIRKYRRTVVEVKA